jgi:hypothetical protein
MMCLIDRMTRQTRRPGQEGRKKERTERFKRPLYRAPLITLHMLLPHGQQPDGIHTDNDNRRRAVDFPAPGSWYPFNRGRAG